MGLAIFLIYVIGGLLALAAVALCTFSAYLHYNRSKYSHIPSPKLSSFFMGHLDDFLHMRKDAGNDELSLSLQLAKWSREMCSPIYATHFLHTSNVVVIDPDAIKEVAMSPKNEKPPRFMEKFATLFGQRFLGKGLFSIPDYETWKPRRRLYDPAFRKGYLQSILPTFNSCVDTFINKLRPLADGLTSVPMKQHLAEVTLDVISKAAFGTDFTDKWNDESLGLKHAKGNGKLTFLLNSSFEGLEKSLRDPFYHYIHPFETEAYRETVRALRMIGRDCIMKRINMVEKGAEVPNDILTHILQVASTQESVDIETLVDDFVTYYIAGQETTGNLVSFAVVMVHTHPLVLERLQAEVKEVLGSRSTITKDDLDKLQYTEQVLLETLRMHSPIFAINKETPPEGLTLAGYYIPGGTLLTLPSQVLCEMPEYFDDPDTFSPDRFDPENEQPSSFVYFPFGLGRRSCIGRHFALMEAKMILARLIQTFSLTLPDDYKLVVIQRTTVQPKDVPCTIELHGNF